MASIDAAARVNALIDEVSNIAQYERTNAEGYITNAVNAAFIAAPINVDAGNVPAIDTPHINLPTFPTPPTFADLPNSPPIDTSGFAANISEIEAMLQNGLTTFFATYFPNDLSDHAAAVAGLRSMANNATAGFNDLYRRLGGDINARSYLNGIFNTTDPAYERMRGSMQAGQDGTDYLRGRIDSGSAATAYLLTKFAQGDQATTTLIGMMTTGGSSIPPVVEAQIWQRDRNRIMSETRRQKGEAIDSWAARGFMLPTGGAAMAVEMIESEGQARIAQSSRERAIKDVEIAIENVKFGANLALSDASAAGRGLMEDATGSGRALVDDARAATQLTIENAREAARILLADSLQAVTTMVETAERAAEGLIRGRNEAITAAVDYIKTLALGPQLAAELVKTEVEAQSAAARATVDYYTARVNAQRAIIEAEVAITSATTNAEVAIGDLTIKPAIANAANRTTLTAEQARLTLGLVNTKVEASMGGARAVATIAGSALSSLNAQASLSQNS